MEALYKKLYNVKAFIIETLIVIPLNKIKITISKPDPLNANTKLVIQYYVKSLGRLAYAHQKPPKLITFKIVN